MMLIRKIKQCKCKRFYVIPLKISVDQEYSQVGNGIIKISWFIKGTTIIGAKMTKDSFLFVSREKNTDK